MRPAWVAYAGMPEIRIARSHADQVLSTDAFGLLVDAPGSAVPDGAGIRRTGWILDRSGTLDPAAIAAAELEASPICARRRRDPPHGCSMTGRVQALAQVVVTAYDGDAAHLDHEQRHA